MDLGLDGKVAVVTGGTAGIGLATARRLLAEGARVVVCGRDRERLDAALAALDPGRSHGVAVDVADPAGVQSLRDAALERFGGVDVLVNNAGTSARGQALEVPDEAWQADLDLKLMAHVRLARLLVPSMRERGGGAVVSVLSIGGKQPGAASVPTAVSRAAGMALVKSMSRDLGPDGIRVNAVCIGFVESLQNDRQWQAGGGTRSREDHYADLARRVGVPLGRIGKAEEAAAAIAFLASAAASYVTGVALNVDGGLSYVV